MHARNHVFHGTRHLLLWLLALLVLSPMMAMAQGAPHRLDAADRAEIAHFQLTQGVLSRLMAVTAAGRKMHIHKARLDMSKVHTLDDMARQLVAIDPRIKPLLARHGFTPHQFVVANLALVGTAMAVQMERNPQTAKYVDARKLNAHNVAFYKAHEAQILHMLQQASN